MSPKKKNPQMEFHKDDPIKLAIAGYKIALEIHQKNLSRDSLLLIKCSEVLIKLILQLNNPKWVVKNPGSEIVKFANLCRLQSEMVNDIDGSFDEKNCFHVLIANHLHSEFIKKFAGYNIPTKSKSSNVMIFPTGDES